MSFGELVRLVRKSYKTFLNMLQPAPTKSGCRFKSMKFMTGEIKSLENLSLLYKSPIYFGYKQDSGVYDKSRSSMLSK